MKRMKWKLAGLLILFVASAVVADQLIWANGKLWNATESDRMSITGQVTDTAGVGTPDVMVKFTHTDGTLLGWAVTDELGFYLRYVPAGWTGTHVAQSPPYVPPPSP